jgi:DNA-directed RNA polymerase subunit E'/Rpb7
MKNMLLKQIHLPIKSLGNNINYILETIISKQIAGKCIQEGYIKPGSIKILTYSNGNILGNYIVFKVIFECLVCCPVEGMHINAIVKNVTKAGIRAEIIDDNSPVIIFIARDHHYKMPYFSSLKVNDKIKVRVIGQRFELEDTYISIIAELIEPYSEKIKKPKIILPEDEEYDEAVNEEEEKKYLSTKKNKK